MPGAYEKQMHGERYELILSAVQKCQESLRLGNYESLRLEIPLLILLQGDRSKKVIEEWCYAGGFRLMFEILKCRANCSSLGDVSPILDNLSSLLSIEFDPFDDDLGRIPLLTFFLCERHTHYVDIQWNSDDLILMKEFIQGHLSIMSSFDTISETDRILALNNLYGALLSYPPHRVVQSSANVFTPETCSKLLTSLRQLPSLCNSLHGRTRIMQLILAATSFGLGSGIVTDLPYSQLLMTVNRQVLPEMRCPCGRCEFFRRLQRVAKERDEFGVPKASEAKKSICNSFIKAGLHKFIADFIDQVQHSIYYNKPREINVSNPSIISKEDPKSGSNKNDGSKGKQTVEECNGEWIATEVINSYGETSQITLIDSERTFEKQLNNSSNNTNNVNDKLKLLAIQILWLCSWECEEVYGLSILAIDDFILTQSLVKSLDLSDLRQTFNPKTGEFLPGVKATIEILCTLTLKAECEEFKCLSSRLRPTIEVLLQQCCIKFVESCGHLSRQWNPTMSFFAPVLSVMLSCVYTAAMNDAPTLSVHHRRRFPTTAIPSVVSPELLVACINACKCLAEGYEWGGCQMDERIFIESLLQSMAVITGRLEYSKCQEARRCLLPPPHPSCGYMASTGRWLLNKFDSIANGEGCVIIRTLGSVVISRAEQAAALQVLTEIPNPN